MDDSLLAKLVVAEYVASRFPMVLSPTDRVRVIDSCSRVSYTLPSLIRLTSAWSLSRARGCRASLLRREGKYSRYIYWVRCSEATSKGPHLTRIMVISGQEGVPMKDRQIQVSCSCEFWKFWGPDYLAMTKGYLEGRPRSNKAPSGVRDPRREHWICKHVATAAQLFYREAAPETLPGNPMREQEPTRTGPSTPQRPGQEPTAPRGPTTPQERMEQRRHLTPQERMEQRREDRMRRLHPLEGM